MYFDIQQNNFPNVRVKHNLKESISWEIISLLVISFKKSDFSILFAWLICFSFFPFTLQGIIDDWNWNWNYEEYLILRNHLKVKQNFWSFFFMGHNRKQPPSSV